MNPAILVGLLSVFLATRIFSADGALSLNNYDSNIPIMSAGFGRLPVEDSFVQILGGSTIGGVQPITNQFGQTIFTLSEPGFFDAGVGVVPGVAENSDAFLVVRAWRNAP